MKKKNNNTNNIIYMLMLYSVFINSYYIREKFLGEFGAINILFLFLLVIYIILNINRVSGVMVIYVTFIGIYIIFIDRIINDNPINSILRSMVMTILPLYMLAVKLPKKEIKQVVMTSTKIINFFMVSIFLIGLIDWFIGFKIMKFLGYYLVPGLRRWIASSTYFRYRYTSYMGHSLFTKELFLIFYLLNNVILKKYNVELLNRNVVTIISVVGVLLTGSKTGAILILISILLTSQKINILRDKLIPISIVLGSYALGFFNTLIVRLQGETLTSGRSEAALHINSYNCIQYNFFYGYGEYLDRILNNFFNNSTTTAYLEYPIKVIALKYGILCAAFIIICIFIIPIIKFIKSKEYYILFAFVIEVVNINTYNGLVFKPDNMIILVFFTSLLMGVCMDDSRENNICSNVYI